MDVALTELTIEAAQSAMATGALTSRELTAGYLERIESVDRAGPHLRSVLEVNPDAADIADALDGERRAGQSRGPLHGIPILLKDNIDTHDRLHTTAGSLALVDGRVQADAVVVQRLRAAGAVILGKTNMSEWANFRSTRSSSGWSGRGRQTRNAFVLDRSPGGSSSGSGVAVSANLCMAALGTETDGSIVSPSSANGIVGIKPTVGLTSRTGVIPISHSQDSVGPHARTVADAAAVLSAIVETPHDYARYLNPNGLRGARVGVARKFHTGYSEHTDAVFDAALSVLRECGAELVDNIDIPGEAQIRENLAGEDARAERVLMEFEFKANLNAYLATRADSRVRTLADVIQFNRDNASEEMRYFGQELLERSQARGSLDDSQYHTIVASHIAFRTGFSDLFTHERLDALVAPTNAPAWAIDMIDGDRFLGSSAQPAAVAGFPLLTVPAGFALDHLPIGLTFMGPALSEPTLIRLAFAFEHAHSVRQTPRFRPTLLDLP